MFKDRQRGQTGRFLQEPEFFRLIQNAREMVLPSSAIFDSKVDCEAATLDGLPRRFGNYELQKLLGQGGMGRVFLARQLNADRLVALKIIRPDFCDVDSARDNQFRVRFSIEAEAMANLNHENIVKVFDVGQADGQVFYSMQLVKGDSLADRLKLNPIDPRKAAELVYQIAGAVGHAHGAGILHRDIKPSNVLIDEDDRPFISDFGLAKRSNQSFDQLTQTGAFVGTASYMSPEQSKDASSVTETSDVYSLGAVLYTALTGRPPFHASNPFETIRQVVAEEPAAPCRINPSIPRDLNTICLKCLEKEPALRYHTATDLAQDLLRFLELRPILARPTSFVSRIHKWTKRQPIVASLVLLLALITLAAAAIGANQQNEHNQKMAETKIDTLMQAEPAAVNLAIELIRPYRSFAIRMLQQRLQTGEPHEQLRAAFALAEFEIVHEDFLVDSIGTARKGECVNIVSALRNGDSSSVREKILAQVRDVNDPFRRARFVIPALQLNADRAAKLVLNLDDDPSDRAAFISNFVHWNSGIINATYEALETKDDDIRSALCAALGTISLDSLLPDERKLGRDTLTRVYQTAFDSGTHSAAKWSLKQWRVALPSKPVDNAKQNWIDVGDGITMIVVPPKRGSANDRANSSKSENAFLLSDREISVGLFDIFLNDTDPTILKPVDWSKAYSQRNWGKEGPVNYVCWNDAALFCNWLSRRHRRKPYYKAKIVGVESNRRIEIAGCFPMNNGYRLPTPEEWEYACRCGSQTKFSFGDDLEFLESYCVYSANAENRAAECGSKIPNGWGFFDMHGNMAELCRDSELERDAQSRGGSWGSPTPDPCSSSYLRSYPVDKRTFTTGFRVALSK